MINPGGGFLQVAAAQTASIEDISSDVRTDHVRIGFCAQRQKRVAGCKARREFFRPIAKIEDRLLVAEKHIISGPRFVVAQVQDTLSKGI